MISKLHIMVPAAGTGQRFLADRPKQYLRFQNRTLIDHTIAQLSLIPHQGSFVVGIGANDLWWPETESSKIGDLMVVPGGESRAHTVFNMLTNLEDPQEQDWVLVHDAVRPCIDPVGLEALFAALPETKASGLSLGRPVYEAVKRVAEDGTVLQSEVRQGLWTTQTPQIFRFSALQKSLLACLEQSLSFDDEMMALHHLGYVTEMIQGSALNIKITRAEDLPLAEGYWQSLMSSEPGMTGVKI